MKLEKEIHMHGEWFNTTEELLAFCAPYLTNEPTEIIGRVELDYCDFPDDLWGYHRYGENVFTEEEAKYLEKLFPGRTEKLYKKGDPIRVQFSIDASGKGIAPYDLYHLKRESWESRIISADGTIILNVGKLNIRLYDLTKIKVKCPSEEEFKEAKKYGESYCETPDEHIYYDDYVVMARYFFCKFFKGSLKATD